MANSDYTYDNIISTGTGSFVKESGFSASVRRMQTKLNRLGYNCGNADGYFGSGTETQVIAFQTAQGLTPDGKAGPQTLSRLDNLSPDSTSEHYGRELTHNQLTKEAYTNTNVSEIESLARTIYGEDTINVAGQYAVAKELWNRRNSSRNFGDSKAWKALCFSKSQYAVMTGTTTDTEHSRKPNQYSSEWDTCVRLAIRLVNGEKPASALNNQCFHLSRDSSYPANSVESTRIQIPDGSGNKFFDYQTEL